MKRYRMSLLLGLSLLTGGTGGWAGENQKLLPTPMAVPGVASAAPATTAPATTAPATTASGLPPVSAAPPAVAGVMGDKVPELKIARRSVGRPVDLSGGRNDPFLLGKSVSRPVLDPALRYQRPEPQQHTYFLPFYPVTDRAGFLVPAGTRPVWTPGGVRVSGPPAVLFLGN
ncbi:MAG: hypothetical protein HQL56_13755 [Magnetococcales bacterium]|nr:hypothetical protein [Magnetococcales bacterium]